MSIAERRLYIICAANATLYLNKIAFPHASRWSYYALATVFTLLAVIALYAVRSLHVAEG